jgi:uncharacterized protein YuzE
MKITYDPDDDMLFIEFNENDEFTTDTESVPGLAIIYDEQGKVCAIEIEDASQFVTAPNRVDFEYFQRTVSEPEPTVEQADAQP